MNNNKIKITRCQLQTLWYNCYIGVTFCYYREYVDSYLVRTPDGTSNIIFKTDCEKVQDEIITKEKEGE